jgi:DNA-binding NtrC family response regulator
MTDPLFALVIHDHDEALKELEGILKDLSVESWRITNCDSAESLIAQYKPSMIFIGLPVWERSHQQLVDLCRKADLALNIIVVGTMPDIELYVAAIERGAFSFIAPPFTHDGLNIIVHSAAIDARERRDAMARAVVAALHG